MNIYYYHQQLYAKIWDSTSPISDHIGFYFNLCHRIIEASHHLDDVTIVNALLSSLPHTPTWDVVKQNLLYQGTKLTLERVTTDLASVYNCQIQEDISNGGKTKAHQLALVSKSEGGKNKNGGKKKKKNGTRKPGADYPCHECGATDHW